MVQSPEKIISDAGIPAYLHGFSAIDSYLDRNSANSARVLCGADLADLARLFEGLRYPGTAVADAAVDSGGKTWYFRCEDGGDVWNYRSLSFAFLEFYRDCKTGRYYDPRGVYPFLRGLREGKAAETGAARWWESAAADPRRRLFDGALILAKYFPDTGGREINAIAAGLGGKTGLPAVEAEDQRLLLLGLLEAANPAAGFELLKKSGFIAAYWPELAAMDNVDHSKEFHPEGNVWKHTMEALRYRKAPGGGRGQRSAPDTRLSLGLLLHDVGKPLSESAGSRRFDGHAELGESGARVFLERLGCEPSLIRDVCYLVRNHMLPAALPRLPLARTGEIMASPLFPALLELYRCDESSSFKGLDGYYKSSAAYQSFLKYRRNPYRSASGKKLKREDI